MSAILCERPTVVCDDSAEALSAELAEAVGELRALPLMELRIRMRICRIAFRLVRLAHGGRCHAVAGALGISRTTIHRWALVSRCFDDGLLRELDARRDCTGRAISFWHLVELSRVPLSRRAALIDAVFSEGLSVAQLRCRVREGVDATTEGLAAAK